MTADRFRALAPWNFDAAAAHFNDESGLAQLHLKSSVLPRDAERAFADIGLICENRTSSTDAALRRAGAIIAEVPGLWPIVDVRVERIAIVGAPGDCFDTSHSDPAWPNIVLISIPPSGPVGDLRLAEGIIHESMHHHLSALEADVALVHEQGRLYSPWRNTDRPAGGVLHGLFVFACVAHAFQTLIDLGILEEDGLRHARRRIIQIREDFEAIDHEGLSSVLTLRGREVQAAACRAIRQRVPLVHTG